MKRERGGSSLLFQIRSCFSPEAGLNEIEDDDGARESVAPTIGRWHVISITGSFPCKLGYESIGLQGETLMTSFIGGEEALRNDSINNSPSLCLPLLFSRAKGEIRWSRKERGREWISKIENIQRGINPMFHASNKMVKCPMEWDIYYWNRSSVLSWPANFQRSVRFWKRNVFDVYLMYCRDIDIFIPVILIYFLGDISSCR